MFLVQKYKKIRVVIDRTGAIGETKNTFKRKNFRLFVDNYGNML